MSQTGSPADGERGGGDVSPVGVNGVARRGNPKRLRNINALRRDK